MKFYSWCDRKDVKRDYDLVPVSFNKLMNKLGVGKKGFYNNIIRPLWNYGLIDIEEYQGSQVAGTKPKNIIVYEYPQNDVQRKYEPLEKVRDYDKDYSSESRKFALTGGKKKPENENASSGGFPEKPRGVLTETQ